MLVFNVPQQSLNEGSTCSASTVVLGMCQLHFRGSSAPNVVHLASLGIVHDQGSRRLCHLLRIRKFRCHHQQHFCIDGSKIYSTLPKEHSSSTSIKNLHQGPEPSTCHGRSKTLRQSIELDRYRSTRYSNTAFRLLLHQAGQWHRKNSTTRLIGLRKTAGVIRSALPTTLGNVYPSCATQLVVKWYSRLVGSFMNGTSLVNVFVKLLIQLHWRRLLLWWRRRDAGDWNGNRCHPSSIAPTQFARRATKAWMRWTSFCIPLHSPSNCSVFIAFVLNSSFDTIKICRILLHHSILAWVQPPLLLSLRICCQHATANWICGLPTLGIETR